MRVSIYAKENSIGEIVSYTTWKVKSWPVQSTCKLTPEPKARVANMCSGGDLFILMLRIRFFIIPGPKIPHSRFEAASESGTFGHGMVKIYFCPVFSTLRYMCLK